MRVSGIGAVPHGLTRSQQLLHRRRFDPPRPLTRDPHHRLLYRSLTDNYEWGSYRPRFRLYSVDVVGGPSLTRVPTDAVETYRNVIASTKW
jgi:hypothetical protein